MRPRSPGPSRPLQGSPPSAPPQLTMTHLGASRLLLASKYSLLLSNCVWSGYASFTICTTAAWQGAGVVHIVDSCRRSGALSPAPSPEQRTQHSHGHGAEPGTPAPPCCIPPTHAAAPSRCLLPALQPRARSAVLRCAAPRPASPPQCPRCRAALRLSGRRRRGRPPACSAAPSLPGGCAHLHQTWVGAVGWQRWGAAAAATAA